VLYARALEHGFHVDDVLAGMRPHPPGYIFYVGVADVATLFTSDSDHALAFVSVLASAAAAAACYLLCRRFAGRALSLGLAIAFARRSRSPPGASRGSCRRPSCRTVSART